MPRRAEQTAPLPNPYSHDDLLRAEDAYQGLAQVQALIDRMKRCKIPCEESDSDCKTLCAFFENLLAEFKGPQAPIP
jgi:hypothetical protein